MQVQNSMDVSFLAKDCILPSSGLKMKLDVYEVVYTVVYDNEFSLQKPLQLAFKMTLVYVVALMLPARTMYDFQDSTNIFGPIL